MLETLTSSSEHTDWISETELKKTDNRPNEILQKCDYCSCMEVRASGLFTISQS